MTSGKYVSRLDDDNRHTSLFQPITMEKTQRVLAYLEDRMSKLLDKKPNKYGHDATISCIDYVGSALGTSFSEPERQAKHHITSQIGITKWVIEALKNGETITDFMAFYQKRHARHYEEVTGKPHPHWKK